MKRTLLTLALITSITGAVAAAECCSPKKFSRLENPPRKEKIERFRQYLLSKYDLNKDNKLDSAERKSISVEDRKKMKRAVKLKTSLHTKK